MSIYDIPEERRVDPASCTHSSFVLKYDGGKWPHVCEDCDTIIGWGFVG